LHRRTGFRGSPARRDELVPMFGPDPAEEYSAACEWYRRQGWRREPLAFDEPTEPAFEAALRERLDADTALVYADWLARHGHPRAPLIVVQHARRARPGNAELAAELDAELDAEEARLFEHHADVLLGTLGAHLHEVQLDFYGLELTWEHGFIAAARVNRDGLGDAEPVVDMLLHHRSARLLRELVIGCHQGGDQDNRRIAEVLLYGSPTPAPPLRKLHLADFDDSQYDGIDISRCPLGDLSGLGEIYPSLEDVVLKGRGDVELGGLALTRARRFALRTSTLTRRTLGAILRAPWPELVELELWFGDTERHYGAECELADVLPLLGEDGFPKLRALRLMNAPFTDELCPLLLTSPRVRALEVLDLSLGALGDTGADVLAGGRDALAHLRTLKITESFIRPAARARLLASGLPIDESPVSPARTPVWQKGGRYTSVNE
jgi:uncharacterized protein (TIGR02996 family)